MRYMDNPQATLTITTASETTKLSVLLSLIDNNGSRYSPFSSEMMIRCSNRIDYDLRRKYLRESSTESQKVIILPLFVLKKYRQVFSVKY
jgi:hypothetical protein